MIEPLAWYPRKKKYVRTCVYRGLKRLICFMLAILKAAPHPRAAAVDQTGRRVVASPPAHRGVYSIVSFALNPERWGSTEGDGV